MAERFAGMSTNELMDEFRRRLEQWTPQSSGAELIEVLDAAGVSVADVLPDVYMLRPEAALTLRQWL